MTALNFTGQNIGAGKFKRVNKVLVENIICVGVTGIVLGVLAYVFARPLLSLYITDSDAAIKIGIARIACIGLPYFLCGIMDVIAGVLKGLGATLYSALISILGVCAFRLFWIFTIFRIEEYHNLKSLFISYPISWTLTSITYILVYFIVLKSLKKKYEQKKKMLSK